MAFLAPIAATAVGSLIGNKLSKAGTGPTPLEKNVLSQDAQAQNMGLNAGRTLIPQASNLIGMGSAGYQPVLNYWSSILSGNRGAATSAMAPEISRIGEGYSTAARTSAALNPRGGPSAEFNAELPFQQQRDVSTLLQKARPEAAAGLLSGANGATGAGSQLFSNATSAILSSTAAGRDILSQQQNMKAQQTANAKSMGAGLFDLINKYGPNIIGLLQRGKIGKAGTLGNAGANDIPSTPGVA